LVVFGHDEESLLLNYKLFEKWIKATCPIQRCQIVETTHVRLSDINLRHRPAIRSRHHGIPLFRVEINPDLFDLGHTFTVKQLLSPDAIRAYGCAIHENFGH